MGAFYNDGSYNFGTAVLPLTGLGGSLLGNYVAESLTINFPSEKIEVRDQTNSPAGQIFVSGFIGGTATLQCGLSGNPVPHDGCTFGFNGNVFIVSEIGHTLAQNEIVKASVSFSKKYN